LRIIDVSNPAAPSETGFFDTGENAYGVAVSGNYAYLADGDDGLYIIQNDLLVGIEDHSSPVALNFTLQQNYPNPFNPSTNISYTLENSNQVILKIYNMLGQEIEVLVNKFQKAGNYAVSFNAKNLSSGIYFYKLQVGENITKTKKMILMR
jgi:hypothetical protein